MILRAYARAVCNVLSFVLCLWNRADSRNCSFVCRRVLLSRMDSLGSNLASRGDQGSLSLVFKEFLALAVECIREMMKQLDLMNNVLRNLASG
ncbi:hypothetical protein KC19_4G196100 [Ceratodon purpureus]|uniref:Uncharacterized protein n=1 Tax=Ceratodon purpureus TaxID=3225 RepID=A0A8T0ICN2_CERPU|nr:hypothetical protein KC19_N024800 [Ceratodon purpureus]KAG0580745.1 hypothetical protein KC19_4G196100 [Ceratodon purpureus]